MSGRGWDENLDQENGIGNMEEGLDAFDLLKVDLEAFHSGQRILDRAQLLDHDQAQIPIFLEGLLGIRVCHHHHPRLDTTMSVQLQHSIRISIPLPLAPSPKILLLQAQFLFPVSPQHPSNKMLTAIPEIT